jgi:hypothetical protein
VNRRGGPACAVVLDRGDRRFLAHVLAGQRCTVRDAGDLMGVSSISTALHRLQRLRRLGLVTWDEGRHGTLRAAVRVVPLRSVSSRSGTPT